MVPTFWPRAGDVQLAEHGVGEHFSVGPQRLLENLLAVRDEEESRPVGWGGPAQSAVVKRSDHRLASPGGSDDQVAMAIMHLALDSQLVQHLLLIVERSDLKPGQADGHPVVLS